MRTPEDLNTTYVRLDSTLSQKRNIDFIPGARVASTFYCVADTEMQRHDSLRASLEY